MVHSGSMPLAYLIHWRVYKLMTREVLAERSGVSVATILKIENKRTMGAHYATIVKLAAGLGISTDDLLYKQPPEMPTHSVP